MAVESPAKASGLKTAIDTIIAPKEAFESLRSAPTWGWALAISIVVAMLGGYLIIPANLHAIAADWPNMIAKSPQLAGLSADQQQAQLAIVQKFTGFGFLSFVLVVPIFNLIVAASMARCNALGRGEGSFAKYWAAACNIGMIGFGIGSILIAGIVIARGADSFNSPQAIAQAVPSLAMLAPEGSPKLGAFLNSFSPIALWTAGLSIVAMLTIGRVPKLQAWLAGIVLFAIPMLFAVAFAK